MLKGVEMGSPLDVSTVEFNILPIEFLGEIYEGEFHTAFRGTSAPRGWVVYGAV